MKFGSLVVGFLCLASLSVSQPRPNIIVVMSDDQGWGDLSVHGNTNLKTPNIDRLAREGASFTHFYVSPVCSPTRAEFLTGRYHPRGGVSDTSAGGERLDLDETTIADIFSQAGYATALYGKWHNGSQYPYHPNARGFGDFYGFCSGHWGDYFSPMLEHNGRIVRGKGYLPDDLTDKALNFVNSNKERPFFLFLAFNTPHSPMQVPDSWFQRFDGKKPEMHAGEDEDINFTRAALAMCENLDWNVGRVMTLVDKLSLDERTIIVYLSDNGPNSFRWNGGLKGRKGSTDEGGIKSPLFVRWSGKITAGKEISEIASVIDLFPTLASLAGLATKPDASFDGIDLSPLMLTDNLRREDRIIFSHWNKKVSARTQRFRLDHEGRLFDIQNDPGQQHDVSAQHRTVRDTLMNAVAEWKAQVLSELPAEDNRPFIVGHPDTEFTHLPARDAVAYGGIQRSNRFPNASFFTNWKTIGDSIAWQVEVPQSGEFEATIFYTCPHPDAGATVELRSGAQRLQGKIVAGHDPPLRGMENDRVVRTESYVKDFAPLGLGTVRLEKGKGLLVLKALDIPGKSVMDFRLLSLRRIKKS